MNKIRGFKFVVMALLMISSALYAEKADIYVKRVIKGSYLDYYSESIKKSIVSVDNIKYYDWVGKLYAQKNKIDENKMLTRAEKNAEDYAIGYAGGYLKTMDPNYNPADYYIIVDNFKVDFLETDSKYATSMSANLILIKK